MVVGWLEGGDVKWWLCIYKEKKIKKMEVVDRRKNENQAGRV